MTESPNLLQKDREVRKSNSRNTVRPESPMVESHSLLQGKVMPRKRTTVVFSKLGLWYGMGMICGNGKDLAYRMVFRSDSEALHHDWRHIGEDLRKAIKTLDHTKYV